MANILSTITDLLKKAIDGTPPPPDILLGINDQLNDLLAVSVDPSGDGISRWLSKLHEITNNTRLHETLLVRTLQIHFTRVAELLTLLGIIKFEWADGDLSKPVAFSIDWDKFNNITSDPGNQALELLFSKVQAVKDISALKVLFLLLFSSPPDLLALEYRQQGFTRLPLVGDPGINSDELLDIINKLVKSPLRLPIPFPPPGTFPLELADFSNLANPLADGLSGFLFVEGPAPGDAFNNLNGLSIGVQLKNASTLKPLDLGDGWQLGFDSTEATSKTFKIQLKDKMVDPAVKSDGQINFLLNKIPADGTALLVGQQDGTHFSIQTIGVGLGLNTTEPVFTVSVKFGKIEFALKPDFLKFLSFGLNIPAQFLFQSDVELSYVQGKGLSGQGGNGAMPALGIEFATPLNLKIGGPGAGVSVDRVTTRLELTLKSSDLFFRVMFRYGATAEFGPLKAVLDGAGVWLGRWMDGNGGLLPPQGIGVSLEAGPVNGGGFLKIISENEFAGVFQLKILGIGAFAYCLYKTLPTGEISFVTLIGIRFPPPGIQISFGFAVSGFGGLVGINRKADTDLIRERLSTGAAGDVLFNDDPMKNAPKLLGDMQLFFPDLKGGFIIGPTLQINWLYLVTLDVGLFIQLPGPVIFVAGTAKLIIGSEEFALIYLRMDFVGGIDATKSLIFFDAALVNSNVLGIFRITGGVALRISYGENGYFLFSVGGFHPSFNPGTMELPKVPRVGVSYSLGVVWLKNEMYLAITSNTFQLGYKIEAGLDIGPLSAHGWFGFDALIQFKPFHFIGTIDAGFDVEVEDVSLCSVHVSGLLSGPGPLVLQASASVKILFVRISGDVTLELCSNPPETIIPIPDIPNYLKGQGEIIKPDNLQAAGIDNSVVFAPPSDSVKLFSPVGEIIWQQKRVPLDLPIQKMEGVDLGGWHNLAVSTDLADPTTPAQDWFGVGTFLVLPDAVALNNPRFVLQDAGIRIGAGSMTEKDAVEATLNIDLVKLPKRIRFPDLVSAQYLNKSLSGMLSERNSGAKLDGGKAQVTLGQETWNAHAADGSIQNTKTQNAVQAFVTAKQTGGIALPAGEKQLNLSGII